MMGATVIADHGTVEVVSADYEVGVQTGTLEINERYAGSYDVQPGVEPQVLPTANKLMERDVSVAGIDVDAVDADVREGVSYFGADGLSVGTMGGGGGPRLVHGEFRLEYRQRNKENLVEIPYDGDGYPIAALILTKGGPKPSTANLSNFQLAMWSMGKLATGTAPTYTGSGSENTCAVLGFRKSGTSLIEAGSENAVTFADAAAVYGISKAVKFKSDMRTMGVYNGISGNNVGFAYDVDYEYYIVYSE
jgi:hypothetical protein